MKSALRFTAAALLAAVMIFSGCSNGDKSISISQDEIDTQVDRTISQYEAQGQTVSDEQRAQLTENVRTQLIERKILFKAAQNAGTSLEEGIMDSEMERVRSQFPDEESFSQVLEQQGYTVESFQAEMEEFLLIQQFLEEEVTSKIKVKDKEMETFYEENPQFFERPESITASHILVQLSEDAGEEERDEARQKIDEVAEKIASGEDFAALAEEYSEGPSASKGGSLGSFSRGDMVPPFEEAAFALEEGEVSDIVQTQFGYHIIKVSEKSEAGTAPFEEVKESISNYLAQEQEQEAITSYIETLKEEYEVNGPETEASQAEGEES